MNKEEESRVQEIMNEKGQNAVNEIVKKEKNRISKLKEKVNSKKGIEELEKFIKEIGISTKLKEIDITNKEMLRKVADSSNITVGCSKQLTHDEIYEILLECL